MNRLRLIAAALTMMAISAEAQYRIIDYTNQAALTSTDYFLFQRGTNYNRSPIATIFATLPANPSIASSSGAMSSALVATNATQTWVPVPRFGSRHITRLGVNGAAANITGFDILGLVGMSTPGGLNVVNPTASTQMYINLGTSAAYTSSNFVGSLFVNYPLKNGTFLWTVGLTNTSNVRAVVGFYGASQNSFLSLNSDTPAQPCAMFLCSSNQANWLFLTRDGTTVESHDTGLPLSLTNFNLGIVYNASAGSLTSVVALTNYVPCVTNTLHLPNAGLYFHADVFTQDAIAKSLQFFDYYGEQDW